ELNGIVSTGALNNLVVGKMTVPQSSGNYIIYSDADLKILNGFNCGFKDDDIHEHDQQNDPQERNVLTERCVTMYFEIDHDIFIANGSDVGQTLNWMTSVFNNVQTLYANDEITVALRSTFVWTSP